MNNSARIGVLGGTFDPIHLGHLEAATAARIRLSLDRVILVPSRMPPHRNIEPRASVYHRFAMTALAANSRDRLLVSDLELRREGQSYTALTLDALHTEGYRPSQLFFIIGADAFAEIETWHDYPRVLSLSNFAVVPRSGASFSETPPIRDPQSVIPGASTSVSFLEVQTPNVSSTEIRRRVASREPIDGLVPPGVAEHIRRHRLYVPAPVAAVL
jgi:nicotinate-nucleotide adenylyltransferase